MVLRVTMINCQSAMLAGGLVNILGGGWRVIHTPTGPFAVAGLVTFSDEVVPDLDSISTITLSLCDEEGFPVEHEMTSGEIAPLTIDTIIHTAPEDVVTRNYQSHPFVLSFPPMALPAGREFYWRISCNGVELEKRVFAFFTTSAR